MNRKKNARNALGLYEDTYNDIHDHPHKLQKKKFPYSPHSFLSSGKSFGTQKRLLGFWFFFFFFFFFNRRPLKWRLTNAKDTRSRARCLYAIVCFYFIWKKIVFEFDDNVFLVGTAWRQTFVMAIRNLSGDIKISPGNTLGDSFTFCRNESIVRWEPSFRVKF